MSDFALGMFTGATAIGVSESISAGTTVTSSGTNSKGSYVELVAATDLDTEALQIVIGSNSSFSSAITDFLIDIAVGGSGSEQVIVPDMFIQYKASVSNTVSAMFHVSIPKGSRISVRLQANASGRSIALSCVLFSSDFTGSVGSGEVITSGLGGGSDGTAIDPGGTINTKGSWVEIDSSLSKDIRGFVLGVGGNTNNAHSNAVFLLDVGVGGAGSEVVISSNNRLTSTALETHMVPIEVPLKIAAGTRISLRMQCSITDTTDRVRSFTLSGYT